ncbi:ankyrin [Gonapodya prolifera JEL478]|uniref:Ankyrin n=1 Tax=Gonapodya prolifera (strain JEL478) TaxID=1344416 RepID=A0A139A4Z3_GONPJ|nr:ankyrin [Gonapodya prolifera JEL478]|eukprot:KXS11811.1 ankyrin [Gonapodya prolifera JEL478]
MTGFPLALLPPELILYIATWWTETRLGLPTGAMGKRVSNVLMDPATIAHRSLKRFRWSTKALKMEVERPTRDYKVIEEIVRVGTIRKDLVIGLFFFKDRARDGDVHLAKIVMGNCSIPIRTLNTALVLVCGSTNPNTPALAELLLAHGANANSNMDGALRGASTAGMVSTVQLLLQNGADLHACDDEALREACRCGHVDVAGVLLQNGADFNARDGAPLRIAAHSQNVDIARLLLERGASIDPTHVQDSLKNAIRSPDGDGSMVQLLLQQFDLPEDPVYRADLLHLAARLGSVRSMDELLVAGMDVHTSEDIALRTASNCRYARPDMVAYLLSMGANVHAKNDEALSKAIDPFGVTYSHEVVRLLLEHGADMFANNGAVIVASQAVPALLKLFREAAKKGGKLERFLQYMY